MNNSLQLSEVEAVIRQRRTIKPDKMNGKVIPDPLVQRLIESADWAPTHARTEPWRFIVIDNAKISEFTRSHADLLKQVADPATFTQLRYDNIANQGNNASHIIIPWMKRVANHKIPEIEEVAAVSAAIQNLILTATALNIASFWSSGGVTHHELFRKALQLGEEDKVLGILFLGYTDEPLKEGSRTIPLSEKIEWRR